MAAHAPLAAPSPWVRRFAPLMPAGEVLDLACGSGRHVRLLAGLGHTVLAVDRDPQALAACPAPGVVTDGQRGVDIRQEGRRPRPPATRRLVSTPPSCFARPTETVW